jgi:hypothetical protein
MVERERTLLVKITVFLAAESLLLLVLLPLNSAQWMVSVSLQLLTSCSSSSSARIILLAQATSHFSKTIYISQP